MHSRIFCRVFQLVLLRLETDRNMCAGISMQQVGNHIRNTCTFVYFRVIFYFGRGGKKTARWPTSLVIYQGKHGHVV